MRVYIADGGDIGARVESHTGALVITQSDHYEIHEGMSYVVSGQTTLGSSETLKILVTVPANILAHLIILMRSSGETNYVLYEGPTVSDAGSAATEINRNRASSNSASVVVTTAPTTSANGTQLFTAHWGASVRSGGDVRGEEWILQEGIKYMILITSEAASNDISYELNWYEEAV